MKKTIGNIDAIIRIILGIGAVYLSIKYSYWWLIIAIIAFGTAITKKCLIYSLLGIKTNKK